jgi:hypothetical protein
VVGRSSADGTGASAGRASGTLLFGQDFAPGYSFVVITGIGKIPIPVAPEPSVEKSSIVAAIEPAWEKPAIVAAEDPPGEKPLLAAKVRSKPAIVAAEDPPSREKPAIIAAKVRETYVYSNPATAAPTPTNPAIQALCNGVRWIPNCQRG